MALLLRPFRIGASVASAASRASRRASQAASGSPTSPSGRRAAPSVLPSSLKGSSSSFSSSAAAKSSSSSPPRWPVALPVGQRRSNATLSSEEKQVLLDKLQKAARQPEELQQFFAQAPSEVRSVAASESFRALGKQNISAVEAFMASLSPDEARTIGVAALSRHLGKDFRKEYEAADDDRSGTISKVEFKRYLGRLAAAGQKDCEPPSQRQLMLFALNSAIPFVVFGMLDNSIMILGGDVVDDLIGSAFQLSTLACAALANTFADVFGISIGNTVEALTAKLGLPQAQLTPHQAELKLVRRVGLASGSAGILVGCLIGMTPLLFMDHDRKAFKEQFVKQDVEKLGKLKVHQLVKVIDKAGFEEVNDVALAELLKTLKIVSADGYVSQKDFLENSQQFVTAFHCRHF